MRQPRKGRACPPVRERLGPQASKTLGFLRFLIEPAAHVLMSRCLHGVRLQERWRLPEPNVAKRRNGDYGGAVLAPVSLAIWSAISFRYGLSLGRFSSAFLYHSTALVALPVSRMHWPRLNAIEPREDATAGS